MSVDFKVIQEIEVLREFAAGIIADIFRCIENTDNSNLLTSLKNEAISIYRNVYFISSMEQAYIARGKLQIINEIVEQSYNHPTGGSVKEDYSEVQFLNAAEIIHHILTETSTPQSFPKAYIIGGQPGAGKSTIISVIMNDMLKSNAVVISGDDFRNWHPNYKKLSEKYSNKYVEKTALFSGRMTEYLIDKCSDQRLNLIIEGTLRTTKVPLETAKLLKAKGYEIELEVMAVNPQLSYNSTLTRYNKMLDFGMAARETPKEHHDKVVNGIIANINTISEARQFDNISLFNRQGICLYSQKATPEEILQREYRQRF